MEKERLISFETAKFAVEKGYDAVIGRYRGSHYYNHNGKLDGDVAEQLKESFRIKKENNISVNEADKINPLKSYPAPRQSELQRWLRDEYKIEVYVIPIFRDKCGYDSFKRDGFGFEVIQATPCQYLDWTNFIQSLESRDEITNDEEYHDDIRIKFKTFDTYEDALEVGLNEGLKLIKIFE